MNIALILAAGSGTRMGNTSKPKQFLNIYNKPLIVHTIEAFEMHDEIDMIVIVTNDTYIDQVKIWCKQYDLGKVKSVVAGGSSRQESVYNGIKHLEQSGTNPDDIILIHDAARPLISQSIISENIVACKKYGAIDTKGEERIPCKYISVGIAEQGRAFERPDHLFDIYNTDGTLVGEGLSYY